uniref:Uncharacterized protein n=1 Tax=Rhizophora mucronata TaxID=61149 RepID=A0A2P2K0A4_RHIMU
MDSGNYVVLVDLVSGRRLFRIFSVLLKIPIGSE